MIRINRPEAIPRRLRENGAAQTELDCADYDADPEAYHSGMKSFEINESIYRAVAVKRELLRAQHQKCCYCESKLLATGYGVVEHFRPKGSVRQDDKSTVEKTGYYWLAYAWSNLLVSCERCNSSHKGIRFPLRNPGRKARNHHDEIGNEEPMLVDPGAEDPRDHIQFRGDAPVWRTPRGKVTIHVLGLDRPQLAEARLSKENQIRKMYKAIKCLELVKVDQIHQGLIDCINLFLDNAINSNAE